MASKGFKASISTAAVAAAMLIGAPSLANEQSNQGQNNEGSVERSSAPAQERLLPFAGPISPVYRNIGAFYRNIGAFQGEVNPFYRNIGAFWGDVSPFYRNIGAFWGDVNPLYRNIGAFGGDVTAMYRNIGAFAGEIDPMYRNIGAFGGGLIPEYRNIGAFWEQSGARWAEVDAAWGAAGNDPVKLAAALDKLKELNAHAGRFWGSAVTSQKGGSFDATFADPLFGKFGVNLNDARSLAGLDANDRAHLFMSYYDGLMGFSGRDHVDHWMKTANWNPRLSQTQGSGKGVVIGLVDFHVAADRDIGAKTIYNGGYLTTAGLSHGSAVGSLIAASHDGKGVMGIAPDAKIAAYNPFDHTNTASIADVQRGILAVTREGSTVVNLSLGFPGYAISPEWRTILRHNDILSNKDKVIYVIAAGNDGITQRDSVNWKDLFDTSFILVGSVDPNGQISSFSNRPGNICLLDSTKCEYEDELNKSGYLRNRFIVAPGEFLLVSDGKGGVERLSGTSFAAPLVSGAIALIHDRWPWLKEKPRDVATIILGSARDMGAPGDDEVYGVGMLDVEASQSPLDFSKLKYYQNGGSEVKVEAVRAGGVKSSWEASGAFFTAFEKIDQSERDFTIPLSSRLVGTMRNGEYFQDYIYQRMVNWLRGGTTAGRTLGFSDLGSEFAMPARGQGWQFAATARFAPEALPGGGQRQSFRSAARFASADGKLGFTLGQGDGFTLGRQAGFGLSSDYDAVDGGVNPVLGFASGGAYAAAQFAPAQDVKVSFGVTEKARSDQADRDALGVRQLATLGLAPYSASAANVRVDYAVSRNVAVSVDYTRLDEGAGLLGVRSLEQSDFGEGGETDSLTIGADIDAGNGFGLAVSATGARTAAGKGAALRPADGGMLGTAWSVALAKERVFGTNDRARLSLSQPLTSEGGAIEFSQIGVVDRQTGEKGVITQSFDVKADRRFIAEGLYGLSLLDGAGEMSAFARGEIGARTEESLGVAGGVRFNLRF